LIDFSFMFYSKLVNMISLQNNFVPYTTNEEINNCKVPLQHDERLHLN